MTNYQLDNDSSPSEENVQQTSSNCKVEVYLFHWNNEFIVSNKSFLNNLMNRSKGYNHTGDTPSSIISF